MQLLVTRSCTGTPTGHNPLATWAMLHNQQVLHRRRRLCQLCWCYGCRAVDWRSCSCNDTGCCCALRSGGHHGQRHR